MLKQESDRFPGGPLNTATLETGGRQRFCQPRYSLLPLELLSVFPKSQCLSFPVAGGWGGVAATSRETSVWGKNRGLRSSLPQCLSS